MNMNDRFTRGIHGLERVAKKSFRENVMKFEEIFSIMDEAFPNSEMRTYEEQKKLLNNKKYNIFTKENDQGEVIGFLAYWELNSCTFFEHLAVSKKYRGKGIGTQIILENLKNKKTPVLLEVELPKTEVASKRISFYKKLGFKQNTFYYEQPSLRKNEDSQQLLIMSYPGLLDEKSFFKYKKEIYKDVYCKEI